MQSEQCENPSKLVYIHVVTLRNPVAVFNLISKYRNDHASGVYSVCVCLPQTRNYCVQMKKENRFRYIFKVAYSIMTQTILEQFIPTCLIVQLFMLGNYFAPSDIHLFFGNRFSNS